MEDEPDGQAELRGAHGRLLAQPLSMLMQQLEDRDFSAALAASEGQHAGEDAASKKGMDVTMLICL